MEVTNPVKMTPEVLQKIEEAAMMDCTMPEIALFAGISQSTIYNWMESDPKFKERLEELRANPFLKARTTVIKGLSNPEHAKWYLERKNKKEFAARLEQTGAEGKDLPVPILGKIIVEKEED